jgi:serine/threonine protein kinase
MSAYLSNSLILDGYRLIRFLGRGGFGEVWLCRSEAMGDYRALKFIPTNDLDRLEKEYEALVHYRKAAAQLRSPNLVPIEHANRNEAGLYYVMPLADGCMVGDPSDPAWLPSSLATRIQERIDAPTWFSSREITALLVPIVQGLQTLSDSGLVHRDVKPENILFFNGQACLGDISLLGADASEITRRGTPGYATPSWYVGGHPDMYGLAATLYALLTGNSPDRIGRAAFVWPPQGEASLSEAERVEWKRLHAVIRRATEEKVSERYVDFEAMARALAAAQPTSVAPPLLPPPLIPPRRQGILWKVFALLLFVMILASILPALRQPSSITHPPHETVTQETAKPPTTSPSPGANEPISPTGLSATALEDAEVAHNALAALDPFGEFFSYKENEIYQKAMTRISIAVVNETNPNIPLVISYLDHLLNAVPKLQKVPNVGLARLLLRQSAGETTEVSRRVRDPLFVEAIQADHDYGLPYRVALLCRLHAADRAEEFLRNVISAGASPRDQCAAFVARAKLKVARGEFAGAKADSDTATRMAKGMSPPEESAFMDLMALEANYPAYASYLKSLPEK